jgi:hypothetical protein
MKFHRSFTINIPQPCTENWQEMSPQVQGRFCAHCQKAVVDVSDWDDQQLAAFYKKQTESVCVRLLQTQLARPIEIHSDSPRSASLPYAAAIGMGFMLLAHGASFAQAPLQQRIQQLDTASSVGIVPFLQTKDSVLLKGQVCNEMNKAMAQVSVALLHKEQTIQATQTDMEGCFAIWLSFADLAKGQIQVRIVDHRYEPLRVDITEQLIRTAGLIKMQLNPWRLEVIQPQQIHVMGTSIAMDIPLITTLNWHKRVWTKKYTKRKKK